MYGGQSHPGKPSSGNSHLTLAHLATLPPIMCGVWSEAWGEAGRPIILSKAQFFRRQSSASNWTHFFLMVVIWRRAVSRDCMAQLLLPSISWATMSPHRCCCCFRKRKCRQEARYPPTISKRHLRQSFYSNCLCRIPAQSIEFICSLEKVDNGMRQRRESWCPLTLLVYMETHTVGFITSLACELVSLKCQRGPKAVLCGITCGGMMVELKARVGWQGSGMASLTEKGLNGSLYGSCHWKERSRAPRRQRRCSRVCNFHSYRPPSAWLSRSIRWAKRTNIL
jgi:hypothetical protein